MASFAKRRAPILFWTAILTFAFAALAYLSLIEFIDFKSRKLLVYNDAVSRLNSSQQANQLLGAPIRVGWPIQESGTLSNKSGQARLLIPVSGPTGKGQVIVWGVSHGGKWTITDFKVTPQRP